MKFVNKNDANETVVQIGDDGTFSVFSGANVEYYFANDGTMRLTIDGFWFDEKSVDELIAFLEFAKTKVN